MVGAARRAMAWSLGRKAWLWRAVAGIRMRVQYARSVTAYLQPTSAPACAALLRRNSSASKLPPSPSRYARCAPSDSTAASMESLTSTKCVWFTRSERIGGLHARPHCADVREHPPVGRIADCVNRRQPDCTVIGVVHGPTCAPHRLERHRQHHLRSTTTNDTCDRSPQLDPSGDRPVGPAQELDVGHADQCGACSFLGLSAWAAHRGIERLDPGLAAGHQQIRHRLALTRPPRDRARCAVLEVIGMRNDRESALPLLRHRLHPSTVPTPGQPSRAPDRRGPHGRRVTDMPAGARGHRGRLARRFMRLPTWKHGPQGT